MTKNINGIGAAIAAFWTGFFTGVKETPRGFFAPAVAIWNLLINTTEVLVNQKNDTKRI